MSFRLRMIEIIKEFLNTTQGKANFKAKNLIKGERVWIVISKRN